MCPISIRRKDYYRALCVKNVIQAFCHLTIEWLLLFSYFKSDLIKPLCFPNFFDKQTPKVSLVTNLVMFHKFLFIYYVSDGVT